MSKYNRIFLVKCDGLPRSTCKLYNCANCLGQLLNMTFREKKKFWFWKYIHNLSNRRQGLFSLSHLYDLLEGRWSYLTDAKRLPKIQFSNCLPEFALHPQLPPFLAVESLHCRILVFQSPCQTISSKCLTILSYKPFVQAQTRIA